MSLALNLSLAIGSGRSAISMNEMIDVGLTYKIKLGSISSPTREALDTLEPIIDALEAIGKLELEVNGKKKVYVEFV